MEGYVVVFPHSLESEQNRIINGPDSFNGITKRVSVRVKLIKTKPKETQ